MCNECCKEIKGWFKSFTRTETLLAVCEGVLLVVCVGFLIFLILHLVACSAELQRDGGMFTTTEGIDRNESYTESNDMYNTFNESHTTPYSKPTGHSTLHPDVECTWEPSHRSTAATRYYGVNTTATKRITSYWTEQTSVIPQIETTGSPLKDIDDLAFEDQSDGEAAADVYRGAVLALVRPTPPREVTFGCTLTAISDRWTLTAASCIQAVEEVDSLDSFVMMEGYGERRPGRTHAVAAVLLHPRYEGANLSYDLAALKSEDRLSGAAATVRLPSMLDYFLVTIGERLTLLGFGGFRSISSGPWGRGVRAAPVYLVPAGQCAAAAALCAGPLYARGAPCNYCAGAPLLRARALLGLQAAARAGRCGVACEPAPYVNIARVRDWIDQLLHDHYDN